MNDFGITSYQATFTVFFAIAWGAISNIQPKWKPFDVALGEPQSDERYRLSFWWFNIFPIAYYLGVMGLLFLPIFRIPEGWILIGRLLQLLGLGAVIIAAGAVFGFYRCWLGIVQQFPDRYYFTGDSGEYYSHPDKSGETFRHLQPKYGRRNWRSGVRFLIVAASAIPFAAGLNCLAVQLLKLF